MATTAETTPKAAPRSRARSTKRDETTKRERPARRATKTEATSVKTESDERTRRHRSARRRPAPAISVEATDQVLEQLETGGQQAISAVREFVSSVDSALPGSGDGPTRAHSIIDSALSMSDRMVVIGSDAIRGIVRSTGRSYGSTAER